MNWKNKKNFPYYIGVLVLCISIMLVLISNKIHPFDKIDDNDKDIFLAIIGIFSALIAFFSFLSAYDPKFEKIRNRFLNWLHLQGPAVRSFEKIHLIPAKRLLLQKVKESCEQILNIEFTTTVRKNEFRYKPDYIVKTNTYFYKNFRNLKNNERSTLNIESLDLRNKISGLVITGEPGNGKTFGLARWISDMVKDINEDAQLKESFESKIPVFISLNGWNNAELTEELFEEWLVEAIMKQYDGLDSIIIKYLVRQHEIIPCADGLDEVAEEYRFGCLKSLVKYAGIKNSLAFSCRKVVFLDLLQRENFESYNNISVFELQTLSENKIISTIKGTKKNSDESVEFLLDNKALIKYISTPLFLNLYMLTFDALGEENKQKIKESKDQQIFEYLMWKTYDDLMMNEKVLKNRLETVFNIWPNRIRTYMVALSNNIQGNWFYIDQIQPIWLGKPFRIFLYYLTSRILSGIILSIAVGFFIATAFAFISIGILASIVVALLTMWMNSSKENKTFLHKIPPPLIFTLVLIVFTGFYQGFSVPRRPDDLKFDGTFSVTESLSGIAVGLFFGLIFGLRKIRQDKKSDIQPVQLFFFNWRHSLLVGLKGGLMLGLFFAIVGICIRLFLTATTFYYWLFEAISKIIVLFHFTPTTTITLIFTFSFALFMGFIIGFILFAIMAGLDRDKMEVELDKKLEADAESYFNKQNSKHVLNISLNEGIKRSLINSIKYGLIAFVILTIVHGSLLFFYNWLSGNTVHMENFIRALLTGIGSAIISVLWFGGFEFIQHYCLRMYLYLFGIAPLQFDRWVKKIVDLAFMRKVGAGLQYYHPKLKDYFCQIPNQEEAVERLTDTRRKKTSLLFHTALLVVTFTMLILPLYEMRHKYWNTPYDFLYVLPGKSFHKVMPDKVVALTRGKLHLAIRNRIYIGTFTGYIGPEGTDAGLLGFPMTDIFNEVPHFNHGAVLYRINSTKNSKWQSIGSVNNPFEPWKTRFDSFPVNKGDTIYFKLNDKEWQNNFGHFTFNIKISP